MSSEKTADMFKEQSEEEIMNWMVANMTPEQIKGCFDTLPTGEPAAAAAAAAAPADINTLRTLCSGKKYVIHKIVGEVVYFWYYREEPDKKYWQYFIANINTFPRGIEDINSEECGQDTIVKSAVQPGLDEAYLENKFDPVDKFIIRNPGENEGEIFTEVKREYIGLIRMRAGDVLRNALRIQKDINTNSNANLNGIFQYTPVFIESVDPSNFKVTYYYLNYESGAVKFTEATLPLDRLESDFREIVEDFDKAIEVGVPPEAGGSDAPLPPQNLKTSEEWKQAIRAAAEQIRAVSEGDLLRIKAIYREFPIDPPNFVFFMSDLFPDVQFGTSNNIDLSNYVKMHYGPITDSMYSAKIITNSFGSETLYLERK